MPLNVRRFYTSVLLVLISFIAIISAQTVPPAVNPNPQTVTPQTVATQTAPPVKMPTAGEIMRDRISKAKAFIAVRNYNAAIYELENIRRETADASVQAVVNVLLMNSYLEQGDYKKAQDFLNDAFNQQKTTKPNATANYLAIASQVVKSARNRVERYRALGLNVSDRTLPLEAVNDLEKMRETLEVVITQSKEVSKDKAKTADALALLEEAANSRSVMARDDYDARRWKDDVADTREQITSSRSMVINAVNDGMPDTPVTQNQTASAVSPGLQNQVAANIQPIAPPTQGTSSTAQTAESKPIFQPVVSDNNKASRPTDAPATTGAIQKTVMQSPVNPSPSVPAAAAGGDVKKGGSSADTRKPDNSDRAKTLVISNPQPNAVADNTQKSNTVSGPNSEPANGSSPVDIGSLLPYVIKQMPPVYPAAAKNMRATGVVRVEVTVDENGDVTEVQKTSGPSLLQSAAKDAIKKWHFKPFLRDGQPVKATGFVNFNFSL